jgi:hypothetical protein
MGKPQGYKVSKNVELAGLINFKNFLKLIYGENIKCKVCESIFHMARGSHNFFA